MVFLLLSVIVTIREAVSWAFVFRLLSIRIPTGIVKIVTFSVLMLLYRWQEEQPAWNNYRKVDHLNKTTTQDWEQDSLLKPKGYLDLENKASRPLRIKNYKPG